MSLRHVVIELEKFTLINGISKCTKGKHEANGKNSAENVNKKLFFGV
jgi:hypothetical protein